MVQENVTDDWVPDFDEEELLEGGSIELELLAMSSEERKVRQKDINRRARQEEKERKEAAKQVCIDAEMAEFEADMAEFLTIVDTPEVRPQVKMEQVRAKLEQAKTEGKSWRQVCRSSRAVRNLTKEERQEAKQFFLKSDG